MPAKSQVVISGGFDDVKSCDLAFFRRSREARRADRFAVAGQRHPAQFTGKAPKFPLLERLYFLNAVRYVRKVIS